LKNQRYENKCALGAKLRYVSSKQAGSHSDYVGHDGHEFVFTCRSFDPKYNVSCPESFAFAFAILVFFLTEIEKEGVNSMRVDAMRADHNRERTPESLLDIRCRCIHIVLVLVYSYILSRQRDVHV
jgi:hypothetical protein